MKEMIVEWRRLHIQMEAFDILYEGQNAIYISYILQLTVDLVQFDVTSSGRLFSYLYPVLMPYLISSKII